MKIFHFVDCGREGLFGNRLMYYCIARKKAEEVNGILETNDWFGREMFTLNDPFLYETRWFGNDIEFLKSVSGWNGHVKAWRSNIKWGDVRRYLQFQPQFINPKVVSHKAVIHLRGADFHNNSHPDVSESDAISEVMSLGFSREEIFVVSQDHPGSWPECPILKHEFPTDFTPVPGANNSIGGVLTDFQTLMKAQNLFLYPISTFSAMAGAMGTGEIWEPYGYCNGPTKVHWQKKFSNTNPLPEIWDYYFGKP